MRSVPFTTSGERRSDDRGAILVLTALVMILMLMIAAFATDLGAWYRQGQTQQRSADIGSLNAVKAYDIELKAYLASKGVTSFNSLSAAQKAEVEQIAFQAAVDAVVESLAISGTTVTVAPVLGAGCCTPKPGFSSITFTADDGTQITITRTPDNEIVVDIAQEGAQYFTSIVRDAPEISRTSVAVLSNCDADCSIAIELNPPFQGFAAAAKGDGYRPLIGTNNRYYAVNHHSYRYSSGSYSGDIVCMDATDPNNVSRCAGWNPPVNNLYYTHNKADDYIDNNRGRIYFPAWKRSSDDLGIACITTDSTPSWCEFTKLTNWDRTGGGQYGYIALNGVWVTGSYPNERMFAMDQRGKMYCVELSDIGNSGTNTTQCPGYPKNTDMYGKTGLLSLGSSGSKIVLGELINGRYLYTFADTTRSSAPFGWYQCWDTLTNNGCSSWSDAKQQNGFYDDRQRELKFIRHNTAGVPVGFCTAPRTSYQSEFRHHCVSLSNGSTMAPIPNFHDTFDHFVSDPSSSTEPSLYGEGFTWYNEDGKGERVFFGVVDNNPVNVTPQIYCYSWLDQAPCPNGSTPGAFEAEQIYGMVQVSEDCVLGVGHSSQMYSFSAKYLTKCTGSSVDTLVYPCFCNNSTETRYGILELPPELINVLESAEATVIGTDGTVVTHPDLISESMDLSSFNGDPGPLQLEIVVESKVNGAGDVLWTTPYSANLTLTVQPTLTN